MSKFECKTSQSNEELGWVFDSDKWVKHMDFCPRIGEEIQSIDGYIGEIVGIIHRTFYYEPYLSNIVVTELWLKFSKE